MLQVAFRVVPFFTFFSHVTATTELYTLSLHDALPISSPSAWIGRAERPAQLPRLGPHGDPLRPGGRSEEHTSELQSLTNLVCRLLLEKKNTSGALIGAAIDSIDQTHDDVYAWAHGGMT